MTRLLSTVFAMSFTATLLLGGKPASAESPVEAVAARYQRPAQLNLPDIGRIEFPITCQRPEVQLLFNQGVALLHALDSEEAERCFRHASRLDVSSAMPWWGLAVANADNPKLASYFIDKAGRMRDQVTLRERQWIEAWMDFLDEERDERMRRTKLLNDLDRIAIEFPSETEAQAFLVRHFIENRGAGLPILHKTLVDALIDKLERGHPSHPISCYRILLWELEQPQQAVFSANRIVKTLPGSPNAMTLAGRLFSKLGQGEDALACFEGSFTAACRRSRVDQVCLGEIAGIQDNLVRWIDQLRRARRFRDAIFLAKYLIEMPALAGQRPEELAALQGNGGGHGEPAQNTQASSTTIGQRLLMETMLESERWSDLNELLASPWLDSHVPEIVALRTDVSRAVQTELNRGHVNHQSHNNSEIESRVGKAVVEAPIASPFTLLDRHEKPVSLRSFQGNHALLVFYLGAGCPHCIEQLQTFSPLKSEFEGAGLPVIAISTDSVAGLQETFKVTGAEEAIPFALLSDDSLGAFRAYGAFDHLGKKPLHGVFLVDPAGKIVWQRVGTNPFMATRALLTEAQRIRSIREIKSPADSSSADRN